MSAVKSKLFLVAALVFVIDHLTKYWVSSTVARYETIEILPGYLRISHVLNSGVAFGLFREFDSPWKPYFLAGMAVIAVIVIVAYSRRMPSERVLLQLALAVTMGGILGNFADRIMHGAVVDFIEVHVNESFYWPTFNVADSAITIGIAMLLIDTLVHPDEAAGRREVDATGP